MCPGLTAPANGGITFTDGSNFGSAAAYSCDEGFTLTGDMARVCLGEGTWTGSEPSCDGMFTIATVHGVVAEHKQLPNKSAVPALLFTENHSLCLLYTDSGLHLNVCTVHMLMGLSLSFM